LVLTDRERRPFDSAAPNIEIEAAGDVRLSPPTTGTDTRSFGGDGLRDLCSVYRDQEIAGFAHLNGEFCFALWDARNARMVLATDHFGTKPMFFREGDDFLLFSDSPHLIAGGRKPVIKERDVADLLMGRVRVAPETGIPNVRRLPAAHVLVWTPRSSEIRRYWSIELKPSSSPEPAEEFRHLFTRAVRRRLEPGRTAAMLSGGLDSTSICMVADEETRAAGDPPLKTLSLVYPEDTSIDETRFIDAALRMGGMESIKVPIREFDPLAGVAEAQVGLGGLFLGAGQMKIRMLYRTALEQGCDVVLDGHGGDEVVSHGMDYIVQLARQGRWVSLLPLLRTYARLWDENLLELLGSLARVAPRTLTNRAIGRVLRATAKKRPRSGGGLESFVDARLLSRSALAESDPVENPWRAEPDDYAREVHRNTISSRRLGKAFEVLGFATRSEGVEARYPFFDRALVEFCVNLPGHEKIRPGETRSILRRALADVLPEEVRRRQDKAEFQGQVAEGLVRFHRRRLEDMGKAIPELAHVVVPSAIASAADNVLRLGRRAAPADAAIVWRVATLQILLEENADAFEIDF
jgi:asparagine synthase (glutamine-hydrolysing)